MSSPISKYTEKKILDGNEDIVVADAGTNKKIKTKLMLTGEVEIPSAEVLSITRSTTYKLTDKTSELKFAHVAGLVPGMYFGLYIQAGTVIKHIASLPDAAYAAFGLSTLKDFSIAGRNVLLFFECRAVTVNGVPTFIMQEVGGTTLALINSQQSGITSVKETHELFTVKAVNLGKNFTCVLLNKIAPETHVIVEVDNLMLRSEMIRYTVNTNIVTILISELYFALEVADKITVYYSYTDPADVSALESDFSLVSVTTNVTNNNTINLNYSIINNAEFDDTASIKILLKNKTTGETVKEVSQVIDIATGATENKSYTFENLSPGIYTVELSGDVTSQSADIEVTEPVAVLTYLNFKVAQSNSNYTVSADVSNTGNADGVASIYFGLNGALTKVGDYTITAGNKKTYSKTYALTAAGTYTITAYKADGTTLIGTYNAIIAAAEPAKVSLNEFQKVTYYNGTLNRYFGSNYGATMKFCFIELENYNYDIRGRLADFDISTVKTAQTVKLRIYGFDGQRSWSGVRIFRSTADPQNLSGPAVYSMYEAQALVYSVDILAKVTTSDGTQITPIDIVFNQYAVGLINTLDTISFLIMFPSPAAYGRNTVVMYPLEGYIPELKITY